MINIYKYKDAEKLKIKDIDGKIYKGKLVSVNDANDEDKDSGLKEDSITIVVARRPVTFPVSEIKDIAIIKKEVEYIVDDNETEEDLLLNVSDAELEKMYNEVFRRRK